MDTKSKLYAGLIVAGLILVALAAPKPTYQKYPLQYPAEEYLTAFFAIGNAKPDFYVNTGHYEDRTFDGIISAIVMYDNRPSDPRTKVDLDRAIAALKVMRSRATDSNGDGLLDLDAAYGGGGTYSGIYSHGVQAQLFADMAAVIRKHNLDEHAATAADFETFVDSHLLPQILRTWKPYEAGTRPRGYFKVSTTEEKAVPYNQASGAVVALMTRGKATGRTEWVQVGQRYLNRYFDLNPIQNVNGTEYLAAKYYLYDAVSGETKDTATYQGYTDLSHLNFEFEMILRGYEEGLISGEQYQLIQNTISIMTLRGAKAKGRTTPVLNQNMQPPRKVWPDESVNIFEQTGLMYNLPRFANGNAQQYRDMEDITYALVLDGKLVGSYYSSLYRCVQDPRLNMQEFCSQNVRNGAFVYQVENMALRRAIANLFRFQ